MVANAQTILPHPRCDISSPPPGEKIKARECPAMNDVTEKLPGAGFKRPWPPLIKMDEPVKVEKLFNP
jgi:hypothetical protein